MSLKLTDEFRLIPESVNKWMPHVPTEEQVRYHTWFLYRTTAPEGWTLPPNGLHWLYTGTRAECEDYMRRLHPEGIVLDTLEAADLKCDTFVPGVNANQGERCNVPASFIKNKRALCWEHRHSPDVSL